MVGQKVEVWAGGGGVAERHRPTNRQAQRRVGGSMIKPVKVHCC